MMIKWINILKDVFLVYDDFKDNGQRVSETMIVAALMIVSSILVLTGVINTGFTDAEVMAIGTGLYSLVIMVIRLRSNGGKIKLRDDLTTDNGGSSVGDEHNSGNNSNI